MHPMDVQRTVTWAVNLVGKVIVVICAAFFLGGMFAAYSDDPSTAFILPFFVTVGVGIWLTLVSAPFPSYMTDEQIAQAEAVLDN